MRMLMCILFMALASTTTCSAATLDKLVITCLDKQEASFDDIYLIVRDANSQRIDFSSSDQRGMSRQNAENMSQGREFILNSVTRSRLNFNSQISVTVMEKDFGTNLNPDDNLGTVTIRTNQTKTQELEGRLDGRRFKYRVDWTSSP